MRLLNASGCLDALTAPDVARALDGFVTKTVTPLPREGNAPPRIAETAHGMLNAIGLANPGRERFLAENLPRLRELGVPLWVASAASAPPTTPRRARGSTTIEAIELNLSCPNVDEAADSAAEIVAACRAATTLPLYAKLSAAHPDVGEVARAVAAAGADGLSLINTLRGVGARPAYAAARAESADPGANEVQHGSYDAGLRFRIQDPGRDFRGVPGQKRMRPAPGLEIAEAIIEQSRRTEIPVKTFLGLMRTESNFTVRAVSGSRAMGLMQIHPVTWKKDPQRNSPALFPGGSVNPSVNIMVSATICETCMTNTGVWDYQEPELWDHVFSAYYSGEASVRGGLNRGHRRYVSKVRTHIGEYSQRLAI